MKNKKAKHEMWHVAEHSIGDEEVRCNICHRIVYPGERHRLVDEPYHGTIRRVWLQRTITLMLVATLSLMGCGSESEDFEVPPVGEYVSSEEFEAPPVTEEKCICIELAEDHNAFCAETYPELEEDYDNCIDDAEEDFMWCRLKWYEDCKFKFYPSPEV